VPVDKIPSWQNVLALIKSIKELNEDKKWLIKCKKVLYFIKYNAHTSIVRTWISQWFLAIFFSFFKNNFPRIDHCKFIHHKSHLKPFLSYLRREYFSIIFKVKKRALYTIKYSKSSSSKLVGTRRLTVLSLPVQ
jgi:hypothetical protein